MRPSTMLTVNKLIPQARGLAAVLTQRAASVELDWDVRQKSRFDATDSEGRHLGVFLARGTLVRGGDVLVGEDGSLIVVKAAAQPVLTVTHCPDHGTPFDLVRAAYHLGNRHVQLELKPDRLQLEPDHVLADMLRQMHLIVTESNAAFEPEGGAYSAGSHEHSGHAHADHSSDLHSGDKHAHDKHSHEKHSHEKHSHDKHSHAAHVHPQQDHGHHDRAGLAEVAGTPSASPAASDAPHVHGPDCGHGHSH